MKSVAVSHFPEVIVEPDQKWLFNPILKKRFKNRPEERVRLQWVEFLIHQTGWKKTRIGFETPVQLRQSQYKQRADLILVDDTMKPYILIECKAESVALNQAAAEQAARYNTKVEAPYVVLTNGITDVCYHIKGGNAEPAELPLPVQEPAIKKNIRYWQKRGFISGDVRQADEAIFTNFLTQLFLPEASAEVKYLPFKQTWLPFPMEHYYRIFTVDDTARIFVSVMGGKKNESYLVAMLNKQGKNEGILLINLDAYFQKRKDSARVISAGKEKIADAGEIFPHDFLQSEPHTVVKLPELLLNFFV